MYKRTIDFLLGNQELLLIEYINKNTLIKGI